MKTNALLATTLMLCLASPAALAKDCPLDAAREKRIELEATQSLFDGEPVRLKSVDQSQDSLAIWSPGQAGKPVIVLAHGPGRNVGSAIIVETSLALNELGYPTLALQMPAQQRDCEGAESYPNIFTPAFARIDAAARWLQAKGHSDLVLFGHWLANAYFYQTDNAPYKAWVANGVTGRLSSIGNNSPRILDVYGSKGHDMTLRSAWLRRFWLYFCEDGQQVTIEGANHDFTGKHTELAGAIDTFLSKPKQTH